LDLDWFSSQLCATDLVQTNELMAGTPRGIVAPPPIKQKQKSATGDDGRFPNNSVVAVWKITCS
jgi:hypothetical protein